MAHNGAFSFGPYVNYWNIKQSELTSATFTVLGRRFIATFWEPANTTTELGMRIGYSF